MARAPVNIVVLGEGRGERGKRKRREPLTPIPDGEFGALEILVGRAASLILAAPVTLIEPAVVRGKGALEILANEDLQAQFVGACFEQDRRPTGVHLVVLQHDDGDAEAFERALGRMRAKSWLGNRVAALQPAPELEAWVVSKTAAEQHVRIPACTGPRPDDAALQRDAKAELLRMLNAVDVRCTGFVPSDVLASLARFVPPAELEARVWCKWALGIEEMTKALRASGALTGTP